jgi:type IV pilus assembly protein PilB
MFLDFLLAQGTITELEYNKVMNSLDTEFAGDMNKALISVGLGEDAITAAKASFYKIPYQKVNISALTPDIVRYVEESAATHYKFVPIAFADGVLSIGVTEPENIEAMNALQFISVKLSVPFKIFLISHSDYLAAIEAYKGVSTEVDKAVNDLNDELELANKEVLKNKDSVIKQVASEGESKIVEDAPIIKIVAVIINHAVEGGASDIHIENNGEQVKVRYRVDGVLHTTLVLPLNTFDGIVARVKILSKLRLDEKRKPQDGSFFTMIEGRKIEFRVSTFPAYFGEKIVMRILDSERGIRKIDDLDMAPQQREMIRRALARPYGLILISGPTGSGKSTTLYSMLNDIDRESANVVSLEDPVEYQIPGVTQSQVLPEIGYTFAAGLRSILRQDPNIIMVGEIRDKETAELAIQAALTGHIVLSTIHTNNSIGIVPRLVDMGIDPYLIAPTLVLAMAQRLVRRVHPSARHEVPIDEATKAFIEQQFADLAPEARSKLSIPATMYDVKPSSEAPSMTRGRIAVFEMFEVDKDIQQIILKNPVEQEIYKVCRAKGMTTLREDALLKALAGNVLMQEVYGL